MACIRWIIYVGFFSHSLVVPRFDETRLLPAGYLSNPADAAEDPIRDFRMHVNNPFASLEVAHSINLCSCRGSLLPTFLLVINAAGESATSWETLNPANCRSLQCLSLSPSSASFSRKHAIFPISRPSLKIIHPATAVLSSMQGVRHAVLEEPLA